MIVVADPSSGESAVNACPSCAGMFESFDDHDHRALPQDESVATRVPRARGVFRVVITAAQGLHLGESIDRQRMDDTFRAPDDCDVAASQSDLVEAQRNGLI